MKLERVTSKDQLNRDDMLLIKNHDERIYLTIVIKVGIDVIRTDKGVYFIKSLISGESESWPKEVWKVVDEPV